jgi:hypothetical protein
MSIKFSEKALEQITNYGVLTEEQILELCETKKICPKCGGIMEVRQNNEEWCKDCNWSTHISLAKALMERIDKFGTTNGYTWGDFFDEMFVPKIHRTNFATLAILHQVTNNFMQFELKKSFGEFNV